MAKVFPRQSYNGVADPDFINDIAQTVEYHDTVLTPAYCSLSRATTQPITSGGPIGVNIAWTVAEDPAGMHDPATPEVVTLSVTGRFLITAQASIAANTTGFRVLAVRHNGVLVAEQRLPASAVLMTLNTSTIVSGKPGDVITVQFFQNSGATLNLDAIVVPRLTVTRVSALLAA